MVPHLALNQFILGSSYIWPNSPALEEKFLVFVRQQTKEISCEDELI